jgi:hypothetical protein
MEALRGGSPRKEGGPKSRGQSPRKGHFLGVGKKSPKKEARKAAEGEFKPTVMKVEAVEYAPKSMAVPDQITPVMVQPPASMKRTNEDRELRKVFGMG